MSPIRTGPLLLGLGVLVGAAASIGLLLGFEPARLPPAMVNIAVYKLSFLAALGLIAGGAIFIRYARRESIGEAAARLRASESMLLAEGQSAVSSVGEAPEPEPVRSTSSHERHGR